MARRPAALVGALLAGLSIGAPAGAQAPKLDGNRAQLEMYNRISPELAAYAAQIGVSTGLIDYCHEELHLKTYAHPIDGSIPFGIDYNAMTRQSDLDRAIAVRQNHTVWAVKLCLANAKKLLHDAGASEPGKPR